MHVGKVDAVEPPAVEPPLDIGPIATEHPLLLRQPFRRRHFAGSLAQTHRREIEHERRRDQRKLQNPLLGILVQETGNSESLQLVQAMLRQPLINLQLTIKEIRVAANLHDTRSVRLPYEAVQTETDQIQGLNAA